MVSTWVAKLGITKMQLVIFNDGPAATTTRQYQIQLMAPQVIGYMYFRFKGELSLK